MMYITARKNDSETYVNMIKYSTLSFIQSKTLSSVFEDERIITGIFPYEMKKLLLIDDLFLVRKEVNQCKFSQYIFTFLFASKFAITVIL
ncbi:hypothetical protein GCM10011346_29100 [Oceanobacillus neutriphilus]|uniref:Uncharacterized protein n=1 Tax=Oceanobacillus neutriphilus TaxID=531815 RepID=A0ABQ2NWW6_9BACI|nr:hypothetical protein GCM10011346_29100 [Oceanobacillus neutriphilus]